MDGPDLAVWFDRSHKDGVERILGDYVSDVPARTDEQRRILCPANTRSEQPHDLALPAANVGPGRYR
tara:strand:+ start:191 stop:391 length:201 start_codon:yes stop_codon:yes gene_type:complete